MAGQRLGDQGPFLWGPVCSGPRLTGDGFRKQGPEESDLEGTRCPSALTFRGSGLSWIWAPPAGRSPTVLPPQDKEREQNNLGLHCLSREALPSCGPTYRVFTKKAEVT